MHRYIAALWQYEFCWRLRRASGLQISRADLNRAIKRLPQGEMPGTDSAVTANRVVAESLHAAIRTLEDHGFDEDRALVTLKSAFVASGGWLARNDVWMWMLIDKHPFLIVAAQGPAKLVQKCHGDGIRVTEHCSPDAVILQVDQCPFHEYFWNVSRPELTQVMRAWDANWIGVINRSSRPISVTTRFDVTGRDPRYVIEFRNLATRKIPRLRPLGL